MCWELFLFIWVAIGWFSAYIAWSADKKFLVQRSIDILVFMGLGPIGLLGVVIFMFIGRVPKGMAVRSTYEDNMYEAIEVAKGGIDVLYIFNDVTGLAYFKKKLTMDYRQKLNLLFNFSHLRISFLPDCGEGVIYLMPITSKANFIYGKSFTAVYIQQGVKLDAYLSEAINDTLRRNLKL